MSQKAVPLPALIDLSMFPQVCNRAFLPLLLCKDRWLVMYGGAGSGKSYFAAEKILIRILKGLSKGKKHKFLCLRKTQPAAKKSIFPLFLEYLTNWGIRDIVTVNLADMTLTFAGGSQIIITGLDDPEKIKSIHGITGVWLEEATEFSYDDFMQIDLRLRGETWDYKQIILTFNPIDENHWIRKTLFTDKMQEQIESGTKIVRRDYITKVEGKDICYSLTVMHSTYQDNRFLDDVYKARLESLIEQDSNYYKIYTCGQWGVLKGLIFEKWDIVKDWPDSFELSGYGLDFGYSVHPTGIVEVGFIGRKLYAREVCYKPEMSNREIAAALIKETRGVRCAVADSAEPKSIAEIRGYGQPCIPSIKGPDSIIFGIQRIKQFVFCVDYNSPNLVKELQSYKWAENKDGQLLNKPVDYNNHLIDALRYIVTHLKGFAKVGLDISDGQPEAKKTYFIEDEEAVNMNDESLWSEI